MKITKITHNQRKSAVYDIETPTHDYILTNGIISHNTMELYSKNVVGGGTGSIYSSNQIFIITKAQDKDTKTKELEGFTFTINIEKSRFVKEKSKLPFSVSFEKGINKYSSLLDLALESGDVVKPKVGWYCLVDPETGEVLSTNRREADTEREDFLGVVLKRPKFRAFVEHKFKLSGNFGSDELIEADEDDTMDDSDTEE